jgi:hypothetical protein
MRSYGAGTAAIRGLMGMALVAVLGSADRAEAQPISWYNGALYSTDVILNCISQQAEIRMQGYVGYGLWPGNRTPAVGEVWYAHLVVSHPGNQCVGGSATHIEWFPPPNTTLAISAEDPLFCFWRRHLSWSGSNSIGQLLNQACNQNPGIGFRGGYNLEPPGQNYWPFPNYSWMEFLVPMRSTAPVNGQATGALLNPDIGVESYPQMGVFVNNDVMFRDGFAGKTLYLDLCTIPNTTGC